MSKIEKELYFELYNRLKEKDEEINKKEAMYDSLAVDYRLAQEEIERLNNIKKEIRKYIKTLRNYRFNVDLGENREQLEIVGSTENFIKDILEILDKY